MNGATIYGLSPEDLAYAKLAAGRPKDIDFIGVAMCRPIS